MRNMVKYVLIIALLVVVTACGGGSQDGGSQPVSGNEGGQENETAQQPEAKKPDYPAGGKEITFIVPFSAGGGYDTLARAAVTIFEQSLPNNPKIIVENVTTAAGRVGVEQLYISEPDGYTIGNMSGGAVIPQIMEEVNYDLNQMEWIGIMSTDYYITAASKKSNIKSLDDIIAGGEVIVGMTGLSSIDGIGPHVMADKMGFQINAVGHKGSKEATIAAVRGDVDLVSYPINAILPLVQNDELVPLWTSSPTRIPELPDVPTLSEMGYEDVAKVFVLPRPLAAAPGTPKEIMDILRNAFQKVLDNKDYQDLVIRVNQAELGTNDPEKTKEVISNLFELLTPYKDLLQSTK